MLSELYNIIIWLCCLAIQTQLTYFLMLVKKFYFKLFAIPGEPEGEADIRAILHEEIRTGLDQQ